MQVAVNAFVLLCAAAGLQAALAVSPAAAEEGARSERATQEGGDRWVPSLAVISGVLVQEWDGSLESEICRGCSFPDPLMGEEELRDPDRGRDRAITPYVGGSLELMTPELPIPTSPRLFVGGEFSGAFGFERAVAREGDPGTIASPVQGGGGLTPFGEDSALGQGSKTVAQVDALVYGAHAGIAFPFELFGRALRVKPAFGWIRYEVEVKGAVVDAECRVLFGTQCNENLSTGRLREISLLAEDSDTFDAIGPGLDIEMDTGRFGPVGTSLFLSGRLYQILGNRKIEFSGSQSFPQAFLQDGVTPAPGLGPAETRARYSFEIDEWIYRVGLGIRFQWLGFE